MSLERGIKNKASCWNLKTSSHVATYKCTCRHGQTGLHPLAHGSLSVGVLSANIPEDVASEEENEPREDDRQMEDDKQMQDDENDGENDDDAESDLAENPSDEDEEKLAKPGEWKTRRHVPTWRDVGGTD
eukprot:gene8437-9338_t